MTKEVVLDLEGLKCGGCAAAVERAARAIAGVVSATVDLAASRGTFGFDPAVVSVADIIKAIRAAGYGAAPTKT
jgi:copper chaperone CopZ